IQKFAIGIIQRWESRKNQSHLWLIILRWMFPDYLPHSGFVQHYAQAELRKKPHIPLSSMLAYNP
ncbi:MAG: hypothetical protein KJ846_06750, partial [Proteobacteria bacterium]|nr:hypothetical protein [Pseudomonadota bacterium]